MQSRKIDFNDTTEYFYKPVSHFSAFVFETEYRFSEMTVLMSIIDVGSMISRLKIVIAVWFFNVVLEGVNMIRVYSYLHTAKRVSNLHILFSYVGVISVNSWTSTGTCCQLCSRRKMNIFTSHILCSRVHN